MRATFRNFGKPAPPARSSARHCGKAGSALPRRSMPARRIIPCLDAKDGLGVRDAPAVKGIGFRAPRDAWDIVESSLRYSREVADELVFYDIAASAEGR